MPNKRFEGLPDFLVIGAGKSGTTSIDKYLGQHPHVFVPQKKEPNFFGYETLLADAPLPCKEDLLHYKNSDVMLDAIGSLFVIHVGV